MMCLGNHGKFHRLRSNLDPLSPDMGNLTSPRIDSRFVKEEDWKCGVRLISVNLTIMANQNW